MVFKNVLGDYSFGENLWEKKDQMSLMRFTW
jgi:hypothetical protein